MVKGTIEVINKYHDEKRFGIDIMRGSIFGNLYPLSEKYSREDSISLYRIWLRGQYKEKRKIYRTLLTMAHRLIAGENIILKCCCKPKACHGDVIKEAVEKIANDIIKRREDGRKMELPTTQV